MAELSVKELKDMALLAREKGDSRLELQVLELLNKATMPGMAPSTGPGTPISDPSRGMGMIGGETRNANLMEQFFNSSLNRPIDNKDILSFAAATGGAMLAPELAIPGFLSKLRPAAPFIRNAPKIIGAGGGGGLAEAGTEAAEGGSLVDILAAGEQGFKDYAGSEALGVGIGAGFNKALQRVLGDKVDDTARGALEFARGADAPIPLSTVKGGAGAVAEKASGLSFFGNLVRRDRASKINKIIEQQAQAFTPFAKPPEVVAPRAQTLLKETLSDASDVKNVAFSRLETTIGKDTPIPDSTIKSAISEALQEAKAQGKRITGPLKELEEFMNFEGDRSFGALERFRKDTVNKITGNYKTKEVGQPVLDAIEEVYRQVGNTKGFDVNAAIKEANDLTKQLSALKKIPGLSKFSEDVKSPQGWITGFVNENNSQALNIIKDKAPDLYKSLTEQRLAMSFFNRSGEWSPKGFVKFIRDNPKFIEDTFGKDQKNALGNFAAYIETTSDFANRSGGIADAVASFGGPTLAGFVGRDLGSVVGTELSGVVLARQLTNPNSLLFKIFSESDPIKVGRVIEQATPFITRAMVKEFNDGQ